MIENVYVIYTKTHDSYEIKNDRKFTFQLSIQIMYEIKMTEIFKHTNEYSEKVTEKNDRNFLFFCNG